MNPMVKIRKTSPTKQIQDEVIFNINTQRWDPSHTIHGTIVYLPPRMANFHTMDPVGVGGCRINVTDHTDLRHPSFVNIGRLVMSILRCIPADPITERQ